MTYRARVVQAAEAVGRELAGCGKPVRILRAHRASREYPTRGSGLQVRSMRKPSPPDTTPDTTQSATRRNCRQPPAQKSAYLSRFCNIRQHPETYDIGLWLRRSRVPLGLEFRGCPDRAHHAGVTSLMVDRSRPLESHHSGTIVVQQGTEGKLG
jgi:hypothetical protein